MACVFVFVVLGVVVVLVVVGCIAVVVKENVVGIEKHQKEELQGDDDKEQQEKKIRYLIIAIMILIKTNMKLRIRNKHQMKENNECTIKKDNINTKNTTTTFKMKKKCCNGEKDKNIQNKEEDKNDLKTGDKKKKLTRREAYIQE